MQVKTVGPLMDRNLVVRRLRERKRLVYAESQYRRRAPSRVGEGTVRLLKSVLEAWARMSSTGLHGPKRERGKERHGNQSSDGAKVF